MYAAVQVPLLLSGLSRRSPQHQAVALRVITTALSALQPAAGGSYSQVTVPGCSSPVNAVNLLPPGMKLDSNSCVPTCKHGGNLLRESNVKDAKS
jgi:hypothetical protein